MKPKDVLFPASVLCNVEASSKKHAIEVVAKLIGRDRDSLNENDVFSSLIDRERLGCTALASGLAIPHARLDGIVEPAAGLIRLASPIEFDKSDDTDVDVVFGIVVPLAYDDGVDNGFSELVAFLSDAERLAALRSARSSRDLYEVAVADTVSTGTDAESAEARLDAAASGARGR